jgi:hypothetical protein
VKANKKSAAKKSATVSRFAPIRTIAKPAVKAKPKKKVAKKAVTPRRFLTKAELEELKKKGALATEAPKGPRRFPTKAELEAMKAAKNPQSAATAKVPGATRKLKSRMSNSKISRVLLLRARAKRAKKRVMSALLISVKKQSVKRVSSLSRIQKRMTLHHKQFLLQVQQLILLKIISSRLVE